MSWGTYSIWSMSTLSNLAQRTLGYLVERQQHLLQSTSCRIQIHLILTLSSFQHTAANCRIWLVTVSGDTFPHSETKRRKTVSPNRVGWYYGPEDQYLWFQILWRPNLIFSYLLCNLYDLLPQRLFSHFWNEDINCGELNNGLPKYVSWEDMICGIWECHLTWN